MVGSVGRSRIRGSVDIIRAHTLEQAPIPPPSLPSSMIPEEEVAEVVLATISSSNSSSSSASDVAIARASIPPPSLPSSMIPEEEEAEVAVAPVAVEFLNPLHLRSSSITTSSRSSSSSSSSSSITTSVEAVRPTSPVAVLEQGPSLPPSLPPTEIAEDSIIVAPETAAAAADPMVEDPLPSLPTSPSLLFSLLEACLVPFKLVGRVARVIFGVVKAGGRTCVAFGKRCAERVFSCAVYRGMADVL